MFCSGVSVLHHCFLTSPHLGPGRSWTLSPLKAVELRKPRFSELDVQPFTRRPRLASLLELRFDAKGLSLMSDLWEGNVQKSSCIQWVSNDIQWYTFVHIFFLCDVFSSYVFCWSSVEVHVMKSAKEYSSLSEHHRCLWISIANDASLDFWIVEPLKRCQKCSKNPKIARLVLRRPTTRALENQHVVKTLRT